MDILQEIKQLKADVMNNPESNADYVKGYASAMSTVEGMIEGKQVIDVEKVVEGIKTLAGRFCISVSCDENCSECEHSALMKGCIDIVKRGGIDGR